MSQETSVGSGGEVGVGAERWPEVDFAAAQFEGPPWNRFWVRPAVGPEAFGEILRAAVAAVNPASPSPRRPTDTYIRVIFASNECHGASSERYCKDMVRGR
jgi:hypothetical protein